MSFILTDIGEEYLIKNGLDGGSFDVGLYNDSTDAAGDSFDVGNLSTEPSNANYSRQTDTFTAADLSGNWGADNDSDLTFDFSDQSTSETIDAYFIVANFTSSDASDGSATDHIIATGALSQSRDIGSINSLTVSAGGVGVTVN